MIPPPQDVLVPERVMGALEGKKVVAIAAGASHSLAVVALTHNL